ncbi:hypothetical protein Hdeb2414_s0003g00104061 [Helianthus debilis subsp. tardiflorus]
MPEDLFLLFLLPRETLKPKPHNHLQKDTDELIHRLHNPKPYSPFLQGLVSEPHASNRDLESDIQELDDNEEEDDDENRKSQLSKPEDHSNEEWDIRTSVELISPDPVSVTLFSFLGVKNKQIRYPICL